jgi:hypothetical protein
MEKYCREKKIPEAMKRRKGSWIGHIMRRNCLLEHVVEDNKNERTRKKT